MGLITHDGWPAHFVQWQNICISSKNKLYYQVIYKKMDFSAAHIYSHWANLSLLIFKAQIIISVTWSLADGECPKYAQNYMSPGREISVMFLEGVLKRISHFIIYHLWSGSLNRNQPLGIQQKEFDPKNWIYRHWRVKRTQIKTARSLCHLCVWDAKGVWSNQNLGSKRRGLAESVFRLQLSLSSFR